MSPDKNCPSIEELQTALEGLDSVDADLIGHIDACGQCQRHLDRLTESEHLVTLRDFAIQRDQDAEPLIPGITIESTIGSGGMGIVYLGRDERLGREIAIKVLRQGCSQKAEIRFARESRAVAQLEHENIVPVFAAGNTADDRPYLVMPYVKCGSLSDQLSEDPLPTRRAAEIVRHVASGLAAAHQEGLVHRDVKPANILIDDKDNRAMLADFGLVRSSANEAESLLTHGDVLCGTPGYMSPEQIENSETEDKRTDIYSLGITLYHCLTGSVPFRGKPIDILQQHRLEDPIPPRRLNSEIPVDLETICLHAIEKSPDRRYQSAEEMADDLTAFLDGDPISVRPPGLTERCVRFIKKNSGLVTTLSIVGLLLVVITTLSIIYSFGLKSAYEKTKTAEKSANASATALQSERDEALATLNKLVFDVQAELQKAPENLRIRKRLLEVAVRGYERLFSGESNEGTPTHGFITAHLRLADVLALLGKDQSAGHYYDKSIQLANRALKDGNDEQLQLDLAEAYLKQGLLQFTFGVFGDKTNAKKSILRAQSIIERNEDQSLVASDARQLRYEILYAAAWMEDDINRARELFKSLLVSLDAESPSDEIDEKWLRCGILGRLVTIYVDQFDMEHAANATEQFLMAYTLARTESDLVPVGTLQNPAWALRAIGKYFLRKGDSAQAREYTKQSVDLAENLRKLHEGNMQVAIDTAVCHSQFAMIELSLQNVVAADQSWAEAIRIVESQNGYEKSVSARVALSAPYVYRMELATRKFDFEQARLHCRQAFDLMESLDKEGQLTDPTLKSAFPQTRNLLKVFALVPKAIENLELVDEYEPAIAASLLVYCCNHFENESDIELLVQAGKKLLALEPDDPYQFAIHMSSLARAYGRLTRRLEKSEERQSLVSCAFEALNRLVDLNPTMFANRIDIEPDLTHLKNEPGYEKLVEKYQQKIGER